MSSTHNADSSVFYDAITMLTDADVQDATALRTMLEALHDNTAYLKSTDEDTTTAAKLRDVLRLYPLRLAVALADAQIGATLLDNTDPLGPVVVGVDNGTGGVIESHDSPGTERLGSLVSITSAVRGAATSGTRIAMIGTGGNRVEYSDDAGATWNAATNPGATTDHIVYVPTNALSNAGDMWLVGGSTNGNVYRSSALAAWSSAASGFAAVLGMAVLGGTTTNGGYIVALGASGVEPRFSLATDGDGTSFVGTQQPPYAALADEPGSIAGAPLVDTVGEAVYHVSRCNGGGKLRTSYASNGFTWTAGAVIFAPAGKTFSGTARIMICQSTGLFVLACAVTGGAGATPTALYASRDFVTWEGPVLAGNTGPGSFAVAGGRVFQVNVTDLHSSHRLPGLSEEA